MALIDPFKPAGQQVVRCFNSQVASGTPSCGINATGVSVGAWRVDFGFDVSDRFYSVTTGSTFNSSLGQAVASACASSCAIPATQVSVHITYSNSPDSTNAPFWIFVF
jgi:hypothetical protein